jgi:octanoyl-[GcvH]:protein N-octanoyltransferase
MDLLLPGRFEGPGTAYAYGRTLFEEVAAGLRPATVSITPSACHVGVTRRDTHREGFGEAVRGAQEEGYRVLVRSAGGGAIAAHHGTFGFSIVRPAEDARRGIKERYDEAAALVLGAFSGALRRGRRPGARSLLAPRRRGGGGRRGPRRVLPR